MAASLLTHDSFTGITIIIFYLLSLLKSRFYTKISILPSFALSIIGPTGMVVFTGEVEPDVQPSSAPRMLMLNFDSDTVDSGILAEFTANLPIYRSFIILFIQEVMNTNNFDNNVESEVIAISDEFRRTTSGLHGRYYGMYEYFCRLKERQDKNRLEYGSAYCKDDFVCCRDDGKPLKVSYVSHAFPELLKKNNLPHIRLHDLRHSTETSLLRHGVDLKIIGKMVVKRKIQVIEKIFFQTSKNLRNRIIPKVFAWCRWSGPGRHGKSYHGILSAET